jgi:hypothetical protein
MTEKKQKQKPNDGDGISDETFKGFLVKNSTETIKSVEEFHDWKDDFLNTFHQYLDPIGTATAKKTDEALQEQLEKLANACQTTTKLVEEGKINPEGSSVTGQRSINEMTETMKGCENSIDKDYFPKTKEDEARCGYTKFELAAVLVRDGFQVYGLMCSTRDLIAGLVTEGGVLSEILRPNQLAIVMYYLTCLEAFAETMADLGMYKIMEECQEIYKIRPRGAKKHKQKRFDDDDSSSNNRITKDGLNDTSDNDDDDDDDANDEDIAIINDGRIFENKYKDKAKTKDGQKTRAIIDRGWSNGFALGEEVKDPKNPNKKKKSKPKRKKTKNKSDSNNSSSNNTNGNSKDGVAANGNEPGGNGKEADGDSRDPSSKANTLSSTTSATSCPNDDRSNDERDNTETTDDDDDDKDDGSSSSEEEDDDYIYYFDPVQKVVGKLSRTACQNEQLIVTTDPATGKETCDGLVEDWDSSKEDNGIGTDDDKATIPGKTELIDILKEILRGK